MAIDRCPHCALPYLSSEVVGGNCPTCGGSLAPPETELATADPNPARSRRSVLPWLIGGSLCLLTLAAGGIWAYLHMGEQLLAGLARGQSGTNATDTRTSHYPWSDVRDRAAVKELELVRAAGRSRHEDVGESADIREALAELLNSAQTNGPAFDRLRAVHELDLSGTPLHDEGVKQLKLLPELRVLNLHGTKVTGRGLEHLRRLDTLDLRQTPINDQSLTHVRDLPELRVLYLEGTRVTATAVAALRRARPALKVVR